MTDKEDDKQRKQFLTDWLEHMQQESWQLELLISGLALFGIIGSEHLVDAFGIWVENNTADYIGFFGGLSHWFLETAWTIGTINLLAHIFLRGLWIGAIGLRYVSGDIDYEKLGFSDYFKNLFKRRIGTYDDFIERLEKICSVIFAYTFLLFFLFLSWNMFLVPIGLPTNFFTPTGSPQLFNVFVAFVLIYFILGLMVFVDFITGGVFKRVKEKAFSRVYGVVYKIFSVITLSFLYRPILYNFLDNSYTRRWFFFSIPYILVIAVLVPMFNVHSHSHFPMPHQGKQSGLYLDRCYYDDLRNETLAMNSEVSSGETVCAFDNISLRQFEQDDKTLRFFIAMSPSDGDAIQDCSGIEGLQEKGFATNLRINEVRTGETNEEEAIRLAWYAERDRITDLRKGSVGFTSRDTALTARFDSLLIAAKRQYEQNLEDMHKESIAGIRDGLLGLYDISIDGKPVNGQIDALFYVHPYLNAKGLECFTSISTLQPGMHEFAFKKARYSKSADSLRFGSQVILPFMVLNQ